MYALYAGNLAELSAQTHSFEEYFEPLLVKLDAAVQNGQVPPGIPEIDAYRQVCRWPFRKLEYSLAIDALLAELQPGARYLDAGCGVTPLAHIVARPGIRAQACDATSSLMASMRSLDTEKIYGSRVEYSAEDLTQLTFADATFDAVSCISVIEHIPAPHDQKAILELQRILKPGGVLVLTVDYAPPSPNGSSGQSAHYIDRTAQLVRQGQIGEVLSGAMRKLRARQAIGDGQANHARSANQAFGVEHLEDDIAPLLAGEEFDRRSPYSPDLRSVTPVQARAFWDLVPGLYELQGSRQVLPAACILRKR